MRYDGEEEGGVEWGERAHVKERERACAGRGREGEREREKRGNGVIL